MTTRILSGVILAFAVAFTTTANASTVSLVAPADVVPGETFQIEVIGDFGIDGFIAGGVQILYDPGLIQIDNFSFALAVDPGFSCPGATLCPADPPGILSLVWGEFLNDLIDPDVGPTLMGTVTATAVGPSGRGNDNVAVLDLADFSAFTGGWFGAGFVEIAAPELNGTSIQIVPLPAAVWFMIGGLGALAGLRRK